MSHQKYYRGKECHLYQKFCEKHFAIHRVSQIKVNQHCALFSLAAINFRQTNSPPGWGFTKSLKQKHKIAKRYPKRYRWLFG